MPKPPLLCLMGATATGKTAAAVALVQRYPFAIISVDSALVYQGMNIGTAKPDAATLAQAPHRLIDIRDPAETYSAADFCEDARAAIHDIQQNGQIPLLVGGTMLYFRALLQGLTLLPAASAPLRAKLQAECAAEGKQALHERLRRLDPVAAARIHPNDPQRVQRALEVFELTGTPLSELQTQARIKANALQQQTHCLKIALMPPNRAWLHERIAQRLELIFATGFVEEVKTLRQRPELHDKPALRAVGYRQVWRYLDGETDYNTMRLQALYATRQLAKRQLTWLRKEPDIACLNCNMEQLSQKIAAHLHENHFF